ncbi:zinc-dependent alcohol dehydrogenase family protein [Frondihabitans peucedani]|uniref:Zinc-dependent alcohol dehydrogenase family protein n=1 Tax=Frondihabitans peucedani TaxID=598626 RepID=A0ABP8E1X0_9MICO
MKAIEISEYGTPGDVLKVVELEEPAEPGAGQVLVQTLFSPVNHHDLFFIQGYLAPRDLPTVPGNEGVGRVLQLGEGVDGVAVGDLVIIPLMTGAWRERLLLSAEGLFPLPDVDPRQLSMLGSNTPTAGLMLSEYADVKPGDWVVQDAASGGVGLNVVAIAKLRGIKTINFVRREDAIEVVRAAGGDVVLIDHPGAADEVREATGGAPVKVAIDSVGGSVAQTMLDLLEPGAGFVFYGNASGEAVDPEADSVKSKNITVSGIFVGAYDNVSKVVPVIKEAAPLVESGDLRAPIEAVYPLSEITAAVEHVERGGKILIQVSEE